MADTRYIKNVLQWHFDNASAQQTVQANAQANARLVKSAGEVAQAHADAFNRANALQYKGTVQEIAKAHADAAQAAQAQSDALTAQLQQEREQKRLQDEQLAAERQATAEIEKQTRLLERQSVIDNARAAETKRYIDEATAGLSVSDLAGISGNGGGRTAGESVTRLGRQIFNAPAVGASTPISRAMMLAGPQIDKLGLSIGQLGVLAGVAGVGVAAVAIALDRFNKELDASKRMLDGALAAQRNYYSAISELSTSQASEQIQNLTRLRPILEAQAAETRAALERGFQQQSQAGGVLGDASARAQDLLGWSGYQKFTEALKEQEAAVQENIQTTARLTQGIQQSAFAANDALEALRRFREGIQRYFDVGIATRVEGNSLTQEQRDERRRAIEFELQTIEDMREGADADVYNSYNERIEDLKQQYGELGKITWSYADQLERERKAREGVLSAADRLLAIDNMDAAARQDRIRAINQEIDAIRPLTDSAEPAARDAINERIAALEDERQQLERTTNTTGDYIARQQLLTTQTDNYFAALDAEAKARTELFAAQQKEADARAAHAAKVLEIQQNLADKEAELWRKAGDETLQADAKAQQSRLKQDQQYYKQVQDIQRRANATLANAIYARDALAAYLAKQARDEDLRKAKESNDERLKEIDAALEEQKSVIAKRLDEQLKAQRKAADDALRTEADRRRKEAEINNRAIQAALVAAQNAAYAAQQIALTGSGGQVVIHTQLWNDLGNIALTGARNLLGAVGGVLSNGISGGTPLFPPNPYIGQYVNGMVWNGHSWQTATAVKQYAIGTPYVPYDQLALIHQGERVMTAQENRAYSAGRDLPDPRRSARNGVTVNINLDGRTIRATSRQEALNVVGQYLDNEGIA